MPKTPKYKKPTLDGIKFSSGLELFCYKELKKHNLSFEYEPKFIIQKSFKYPSTYLKYKPKKKDLSDETGKTIRDITYKPDFVSKDHKFIIETKGFVRANDSFPVRWKLFLKYLKDNDMDDYMLFIPKNQSQVRDCIEVILENIR